MRKLGIWEVVVIVMIAIICSSTLTWFASTSFREKEQLDNVVFALDWIVWGKHALFYPAVELGYYYENGISCTIVRGFGSSDTVKRVDIGSAEFGFADTTSTARARSMGGKVKIVGMVVHEGADGIATATDTGIEEPKDLEGKILGCSAGDSGIVLFPAFCDANNVDINKVEIMTLASEAEAPMLASGQTDATTTTRPYLANKLALEEVGREPYYLWYGDWGLKIYGHGIITSDKLVEENPDLVRRFLEATYKSIQWTIDHPEEAIDILLKYHPDLDRETSLAELEDMFPTIGESIIEERKGVELGIMDSEIVELTIDTFVKSLDIEEFPAEELYTNKFLE